jgi:hypothetical protein
MKEAMLALFIGLFFWQGKKVVEINSRLITV